MLDNLPRANRKCHRFRFDLDDLMMILKKMKSPFTFVENKKQKKKEKRKKKKKKTGIRYRCGVRGMPVELVIIAVQRKHCADNTQGGSETRFAACIIRRIFRANVSRFRILN